MPRTVPGAELDSLVATLGLHPSGLSLRELAQARVVPGEIRSLQRRLRRLIGAGLVHPLGQGRSTRYAAGPAAAPAAAYTMDGPRTRYRIETPSGVWVPLSPVAQELLQLVRQPLSQRTPVGYQSAWLEQYEPNRTYYLTEDLRAELHPVGRSPVSDAPAGTFVRQILKRFKVDLSYGSSRLEGNTYTRADTERLLSSGVPAEKASTIDTQMILNHTAALEYLVHLPHPVKLTVPLLSEVHALLADGLLTDPADCGRLRQCPVGIHGSLYHPLPAPAVIAAQLERVLAKASAIEDPFEQSFFLTVHLPYLQPFVDVNKRVARLIANLPFFAHNLCPMSYLDLPTELYTAGLLAVYEFNRVELLRDVFVWAYGRSCQEFLARRKEMIAPDPFRLRFRTPLSHAVAALIRALAPIDDTTVRAHLPPGIAAADVTAFIRLVQTEFRSLNSANVVRFGVRPLEYEAWLHRER